MPAAEPDGLGPVADVKTSVKKTPGPPRVTAFGVSIALHGLLAAVFLVVAGIRPEQVATKTPSIHTNLVFMVQTGPGGGGGGRPIPAPSAKLQIPEHRLPAMAVPSVVVPVDPPPVIDAPIQSNSNVLQGSSMALNAPPGPGGGGPGNGVGPGRGDGVGEGDKRGAGGGEPAGGAVTPPRVVREVKAAYTAGALAAKIQGSVTIEAEVLANGTVGSLRVIKSLDRIYGLDQEALRAARQWLFIPGRSGGKPVDVIVHLVLDFNLR